MRFRVRHVQQSIRDYLGAQLDDRGWVTEPVNYDTTPVTLIEDVSVEDSWEDLQDTLELNTVAVTIADEGPDEVIQLGGGLLEVEYSLFVDCYGESGVMASRILQDVKEILRDVVLHVVDYSGETPVQTGERIEFEIIAIERPRIPAAATVARRRWRALTATARVVFEEG